jgi:collagenase-like PrtC family protease
VGGGRPTALLANIGRKDLVRSVRLAHEHGLKFYYLLNSSCMANEELTRTTNRQIHALLDAIAELGVDGVVVALPYMLSLVKRRFPKLRVSVSTFAGICNAQRARQWQDRGADRLILPPDVNRDRPMLEKIRRSVTCELELFANVMCCYQCPSDFAHASANGHASRSTDALGGFGIDYHSYQCTERRLRSPGEFIRGRFIRPEDMDTYRDIGIDVLKLSERLRSTPWLIRVASAYSSRRYDGNLADLIAYPVFHEKDAATLTDTTRFYARGRHVNAALLRVIQEVKDCETPVYIDNRKLDGFLDHYFRRNCEGAVCGVDCRYCDSVAARAVSMDGEKQARCLAHVQQISRMLESRDGFTADNPIVRLGMGLKRTLTSRKNRFGAVPEAAKRPPDSGA